MKLAYIGIATPNLTSLSSFYKDVLGFTISATMSDAAIEMEKDGIKVVLFSNKAMVEASGDNSFLETRTTSPIVITIEVDTSEEVDKEYKRIIGQGGKAVTEPEDKFWNQRTAFIADPDGNCIQLFTELKK